MSQTSKRWRALPPHAVTWRGNFSGRSWDRCRQLNHKTLRASAKSPLFQVYCGHPSGNPRHRKQGRGMALEAISQDGRTQRRNGRLPPSAHSKEINGESQAPAGDLLGRLANFGKLGPALSAQIPLFHHRPDRLEQSCHAVSVSARHKKNRGTRPKSDASKC